MRNQATRATARLALVLAVAAAASCGDDYLLDVTLATGGGLPVWYQVSDVVDLTAIEVQVSATEPATPPSNQAPSQYTWTSSDPGIAEVVSPGRLRMSGVGQARITVRSPHQTKTFTLNVLPRVSQLVLSPDSAEIAVGELVVFETEALDAIGTRIPAYNDKALIKVRVVPPGASFLSIVPPQGYDEWPGTGIAAGTVRVVAEITGFQGSRLNDTVRVVVRP